MAAYVIAEIEVTDPDRYEQYKRLSGKALTACGGRFIARGGETVVLEGDWSPSRLVILEFDTVESAKKWWASEEYREAKEIRLQTAKTRMIVVGECKGRDRSILTAGFWYHAKRRLSTPIDWHPRDGRLCIGGEQCGTQFK